MTVRAVHQFVASLVPHDAVGAHTLAVQELVQSMGLESEVYVQAVAPELRDRARHYLRFERDHAGAGDGEVVLLYQASTGARIAEYLLHRPEPLVVNHHNITPPRYFEAWEPRVAVELRAGLRQLADLGEVARLGVAVSRFNEADLRSLGFGATAVAPVLVDVAGLGVGVDEGALARLVGAKAGGGSDWLFVGRVVPHKCHHDVVKAFAWYRRVYDGAARLHLVGGAGPRSYVEALRRLVGELGLSDAVSLPGSVSAGELAAYYRAADVFVCVSEHEGFCIPLIEAMAAGVPVVALGAAAVPETLAGAGVVLEGKRPSVVAAAVARVLGDGSVREALVAAGRERVEAFSLEVSRARFAEVIRTALEAAA